MMMMMMIGKYADMEAEKGFWTDKLGLSRNWKYGMIPELTFSLNSKSTRKGRHIYVSRLPAHEADTTIFALQFADCRT